jgi:hypothetical protein
MNAQPAKITVAVRPSRPRHFADAVGHFLRGHQHVHRRRHLSGTGAQPLVRGCGHAGELEVHQRRDGQSEAAISTADVHGQPPPLNAVQPQIAAVKADGAFTLQNEGYWGMNIVQGDGYTLKLRGARREFDGKLTVKILVRTARCWPAANFRHRRRLEISHAGADRRPAGDPKAKLEISGDGQGVLFLDMVSLLPKKTWKDHGLRPDLAESLDALHPKFLRFPGGCWVEGDDFAHMNHWKNTIGNIDTRTPLWNIWGYNATHGLGFYEYLQFGEDLGAEPLFCINIGMSHKETIPMDRMASGCRTRWTRLNMPTARRIPSGARCAPPRAIPRRSI